MKAFFLKLVSFFRTFIRTFGANKSANVKIDSNHDGKTDIEINVK